MVVYCVKVTLGSSVTEKSYFCGIFTFFVSMCSLSDGPYFPNPALPMNPSMWNWKDKERQKGEQGGRWPANTHITNENVIFNLVVYLSRHLICKTFLIIQAISNKRR